MTARNTKSGPATKRKNRVRTPQGELVSGRQLSAARHLAGIKQQELAKAAMLNVNSIRYMEARNPITSAPSTIKKVVTALAGFGVEFTRHPALGVQMRSPGKDASPR